MPRPIGLKHSEETKQKISQSHLGMRGINTGRKKEWISKNCQYCDKSFEVFPCFSWIKFCSKNCRVSNQIGKPSWNKGLLGYRAGIKRPYMPKGENHWSYIKNRTQLKKRQERNDYAYIDWRRQVIKRDGECRIQSEICRGYLIVHHILPWKDYPEERYNVNNGITLCQGHHPLKRVEEKNLIPTFQELVALKKY